MIIWFLAVNFPSDLKLVNSFTAVAKTTGGREQYDKTLYSNKFAAVVWKNSKR